ncbi:MAG: hypothetical protein M0C28_36970 [Candidatus Moduliflexus flocculans]|nr:hypothetical protein [Candidatus Moduliflexus flocculans]
MIASLRPGARYTYRVYSRARAPRRGGGDGRFLVPRAGDGRVPPGGVRRLGPRHSRPIRRRAGHRGGGGDARRSS